MGPEKTGPSSALEGYVREFTKVLLTLARKKSKRKVFEDYCRLEAVEILYLIGEATQEDAADHKSIIDGYTAEELKGLQAMSRLTLSAIEQVPYRDLLREVFMYNDLGRGHNDQYFTHPNISIFMSAVLAVNQSGSAENTTANRIKKNIMDHGVSLEADTSCGSGVQLLGRADITKQILHLEQSDVLILDGTDIDRSCADMCYIQLSAYKLTGLVRWDNGLWHQDKCVMMTPQYKKNLIHARKHRPDFADYLIGRLSLKAS